MTPLAQWIRHNTKNCGCLQSRKFAGSGCTDGQDGKAQWSGSAHREHSWIAARMREHAIPRGASVSIQILHIQIFSLLQE
jgi:hypothetical protein